MKRHTQLGHTIQHYTADVSPILYFQELFKQSLGHFRFAFFLHMFTIRNHPFFNNGVANNSTCKQIDTQFANTALYSFRHTLQCVLFVS